MWGTCQHVQNEPDAGKIEKGSKGEPRKEEFNLLRVSLSGAHRVNGGALLINSVFSVASCEVTRVEFKRVSRVKWQVKVGRVSGVSIGIDLTQRTPLAGGV